MPVATGIGAGSHLAGCLPDPDDEPIRVRPMGFAGSTRQLAEALVTITATTWIAVGSLVIAIISLSLSLRRNSFDRKLSGEMTATSLRLKLHRGISALEDYRRALPAWRRACQECRHREHAEFDKWSESANNMTQRLQKILDRLDKPATTTSAITLERQVADFEALAAGLERLLDEAKSLSADCPSKQPLSESERND